jgi:hypothetical protein
VLVVSIVYISDVIICIPISDRTSLSMRERERESLQSFAFFFVSLFFENPSLDPTTSPFRFRFMKCVDPLNDVWRSTDKGSTWSLVTSSASWSGRAYPASVVFDSNTILLMGGFDTRSK